MIENINDQEIWSKKKLLKVLPISLHISDCKIHYENEKANLWRMKFGIQFKRYKSIF